MTDDRKTYDYSVVTPIYGTEYSLEALLEGISGVLAGAGHSFEIICVNDASPDGSWDLLRRIKRKANYPLVLVNLASNHGQHKALLCGMSIARGKSVVIMDSDLQIPPSEITKLITAKDKSGADVVYGQYKQKQHGKVRNRGSALLGWILNRFGSQPIGASSFKLIDRRIIRLIVDSGFEYIYLDEMIGWFTSNIARVYILHHPRSKGKSSYDFFRLIRMAVRILFNYTSLPLLIMTYGGLSIGVVCFFLGLYFILMKIIYDSILGFTAIIVAVLFSTGIILFSLGIIGEYVRKLYFIQLRRPPFHIKEVLR